MPSPLAMTLASQPSPSNPAQETVQPTNVGQIYQNAYNQQLAQYQLKQQQQNAFWGGLASMAGTIGGAALGGPMGAALGGALGKGLAGAAQGTSSLPSEAGANTAYSGYNTTGGIYG